MVTPITLRATKGSGLTNAEIDGNFSALREAVDGVIQDVESIEVGGISDGNKGDVVVASGGSAWSVPALAGKAALQTGALAASTNASPNASAVIAAIAASGVTAPVQRIATTATPPLDTAGNGKAFPLVFGDRAPVNAPLTLLAPLFSSMVDGGICRASYRVNVGGSVDDAAFIRGGLAMDAGYDYEVLFVAGSPKPLMSVVRGDAIPAVDTTAPLIGIPAIADGARGFIDTPISELNTPSLNGALGGVTLTGFGGKTATAVSVLNPGGGYVLRTTLSVNAAYGETGTIAFAAGMVKDPSNNLSVAKAATAVTNNIAIPAPVFSVTTAPPNGAIGSSAPGQYTASNSPTYTVQSGALPTGQTLNASTGAVTGTKTAAATFNWVIRASNLGGFVDTDNQTCTVSAALTGALSAAIVHPGSGDGFTVNLTTDAQNFRDWFVIGGSASKLGGTAIGDVNYVNSGFGTTGGISSFSWDASDESGNVAGSGANESLKVFPTDTAQPAGFSLVAAADTTLRKVRLYLATYQWTPDGDLATVTVNATLSDSSAAPISEVLPVQEGYKGPYVEITFRAAAAGQTLTASITKAGTATGSLALTAGTST